MGSGSEEQGSELPLSAISLEAEFASFVAAPTFPCLGAKAAFNAGSYLVSVYDQLASDRSSQALASGLEDFTRSEIRRTNEYATFVAIFRQPRSLGEEDFERLLWLQLQKLHQIDAKRYAWDPSVASDPADQHFSFSFASEALYVVGMHANSSRISRRFPWPALIFNPHEQFERLRSEGKWRRMQAAIRARDFGLQGSVNPMLSDFGEESEAWQYSGRLVDKHWHAPFRTLQAGEGTETALRCPFAH
ncbi:MAG: YqcI/YcgG family protein [Chthoniobacterales bacterium]|nr:YqcI/YcgG family protein [Chthoniobacterales bacterium]